MRPEFTDRLTERKWGQCGWGGRQDRKDRQKSRVRSNDRVSAWLLAREFNERKDVET